MVLRMGTWGNRASLRNALCLFWLLALILTPVLLSQLLYATLD
ncbi:MAG TPA: hypothetical protein VMB81_05775 [Candidatus Sulfotelmatobacter sp.]|nr:hypothetical protein [Candidatus Sulfotelmatobacter sp.]